MNVSIITSFYHGNKYINQYIDMIKSLKLESDDSLEVIMVNDSPEEPLALPEYGNIDIKVIVNEVNSGIHKARVNGLSHAKGDYVIFVDQDDLLMPDTILDYKHKLVDEDLIIANGIYELKMRKSLYSEPKGPSGLLPKNWDMYM